MKLKRDLMNLDLLVDCLQRKNVNKDYLDWNTICYTYNMNSSSRIPWVSKEHLQTFLGERITESIRKILKLRKEDN